MKTHFLLFLAVLLFASCSKDNNSIDDDNYFNSTFTAKIDGVPFTADFALGVLIRENGTGDVQWIQVRGDKDGESSITLAVPPGTGTYTFVHIDDDETPVGIYTDAGMINFGYSIAGGSLHISHYSATRIKGTFSFTTQPIHEQGSSVSITEGVFDVEIP